LQTTPFVKNFVLLTQFNHVRWHFWLVSFVLRYFDCNCYFQRNARTSRFTTCLSF